MYITWHLHRFSVITCTCTHIMYTILSLCDTPEFLSFSLSHHSLTVIFILFLWHSWNCVRSFYALINVINLSISWYFPDQFNISSVHPHLKKPDLDKHNLPCHWEEMSYWKSRFMHPIAVSFYRQPSRLIVLSSCCHNARLARPAIECMHVSLVGVMFVFWQT